MTMNQNICELDTMMFFDNALESERTYLLQHPIHCPMGLALYVELRYMTDALMLGEWYE